MPTSVPADSTTSQVWRYLRVGESLVAGSPIGIAGAGRPQISLELRRLGEPVNPLEYIKAL